MVRIALFSVLLFSAASTLAEPSPPAEAMQGLKKVAAPTSTKEALEKLEAVFGSFDAKRPVLWWVNNERTAKYPLLETCADLEKKPKVGGEVIESEMRDQISYATPFQFGGRVAYDSTSMRRSKSTSSGGKEVWAQMRHSTVRTSFQLLSSGQWKVERVALSHSHMDAINSVFDIGIATWYEDGFGIKSAATDGIVAADGEICDAALYVTRTFRKINEKLIIKGEYRYYRMAKAPDGTVLPFPDFSKELTKKYEFTYDKTTNSPDDPSDIVTWEDPKG